MDTNEALSTPKTQGKEASKGTSQIVTLISVGIMIILGVMVFNMKSKINDLSNELKMRPPVIIMDYTKIIQSLPDTSSETTEKALLATKELLSKLKDAGYVVLNSQAISTAPDDNYVPTTIINEMVK